MHEGRDVLLILGGIWLLLGLVFTLIGGLAQRRSRDWVVTRGWIVQRPGALLPDAYPRYCWYDSEGRLFEAKSYWRGNFRIGGTPVAVRYDPDHPASGVIDGPLQRGTLFLTLGLVIAGCAALMLIGALVVALS